MTRYDIYLVGPNYRGDYEQASMIGIVEVPNPEKAIEKGKEIVENGGDNVLASAGYNVHDNVDEIKEQIRVYPSNYRTDGW